jgi:hypothetical protein
MQLKAIALDSLEIASQYQLIILKSMMTMTKTRKIGGFHGHFILQQEEDQRMKRIRVMSINPYGYSCVSRSLEMNALAALRGMQ